MQLTSEDIAEILSAPFEGADAGYARRSDFGVPGPDGFIPDSAPWKAIEAQYGRMFDGNVEHVPVVRKNPPKRRKTAPGTKPADPAQTGRLAECVADACWNRKLPVNPLDVGRKAGILCRPSWNMPGIVAYAYDGSISRNILIYNPRPRDTKITRIAIAHAVGHGMLHHRSCGCRFRASAPFVSKEEEDEAYRFGMRLLMPDHAVLHAIRKGADSGDALSRIFDVERRVVFSRLCEMKREGLFARILPGFEATFFGKRDCHLSW